MRKIVESFELRDFASRWPGAGFPDEHGIAFDFDVDGNLVDVDWFNSWSGKSVPQPDGVDERAVLAVALDAQLGNIGTGV